jgi:very-short-patch-repair endonuclease
MDRGLWTLYLGFGLLEWEDAPRSAGAPEKAYSPLLLVPVTAKRDSLVEPFRIRRAEEEQRFNPALLAKLEDDFGITIQLPGDDEELEPHEILKSIARQVSQKGWRVQARTVLSTFSFHKEPILRDLVTNEELVLANEAVRGLAIGSDAGVSFEFEPINEAEVDQSAPPEKTVTILDADSSQRRAIAAAVAGRSFVMDGPPGTGKSQTIANMIADLLARRKTILFVSDKAAALDVVYARLKAAGLSEFVLELHSHKATRKEVAKELGKSLLTRVRAESSMPESDRERLRRKREQLNDYVTALNEARLPLGQSLHHVIGRIARLQALPQAPPPRLGVQDLGHAPWAQIIEQADALGRAWGPIARRDGFLWRELVPSDWDAARRVRVLSILESSGSCLAKLAEAASGIAARMCLPSPTSTSATEQYHAVEKLLQERAYIHAPWLSGSNDQKLRDRLEEARGIAASLEEAEGSLDRELGPRWRELRTEGAGELLALVAAARGTMPRPTIDGATTSVTLETVRQVLVQATAVLEECTARIDLLTTAFDQPNGAISFGRALELGRLACLADTTDLPEADWFAPSGLKKAREAIHRLRPLLETVRTQGAALKEVFKRDVLALDLETLCVRFKSTYRGVFRWFNADYRRDRRALKLVTRSGRVHREEVARLPDALEWQRAVSAFEAAATGAAKILGHFIRGEETDLDAAERGVGIAETACKLAGTTIGPESLAKRLAWGADLGAGVAQAALRILELEPRWNTLGAVVTHLRTPPLTKAIDGARQADTATLRVIDELHVVDTVAGRPVRLDDAERWLRLRREIDEAERDFCDRAAADAVAFGAAWSGRSTEWDRLAAGLAWAGSVKSALGGVVSPESAARLATMSMDEPALVVPLDRWAGSIGDITALFEEQRANQVREQLRGSFDATRALLSALTESIDDVGEWHSHVRAIAGLTEQGLAEATTFCLSKRVPAEHVRDILERALCEAWADDVLKNDPRLATFRADDRDALARDFRRLDRQLIQLAAREAIAACSQMRPSNVQGAAGIILNEAEKQKKHMPVRELVGRTREVVQAIKPCFMMSPLSVSQFLPPDIVFDVVIFDEASQVRPADAISSIYRGRQLVVAGDQKQLPPTSFFERIDDGEDDTYVEDEPDQFESVLDKCKGSGVFTSLPLRWHYRSQHEHLIAYSNHSFYDGTLITFPGAVSDAPDLGIEAFRCEGVYRRGGQRDNPEEAALVGERVLFHARTHPSLSIGVVAFSEAQASAIDAVIERLADEHPGLAALRAEDRLNGLFVKNLETVQGDERDIIIFSMGYGKDEAGKFTMNFGPLSKPGGQRRLNVAITRARRKVEFVTSVRASDFAPDLAVEGARHLKRYLEYAERRDERMAVLAIPVEEGLGDFESPFEAEVARTIRAWGHDVVPQVGCSDYRIDLGVRSLGAQARFVLGVECDGAMYHSSRAARDRDRLRQEVLERLGWRLLRIWGPSWYRHRSEQERRLRKAIDDAIREGPVSTRTIRPATSNEQPKTQVVQWDPESLPAWATTYKLARLPDPPRGLQMTDVRAREALKRVIIAVIFGEGPLHRGRLLRRAKSAFEVERAGSRIQDSFDTALDELKAADRRIHVREDFLWIEGSPLTVRLPRDEEPETRRPVGEVAPQELERAIERTVQDALRINREALMTYVARLYGWDRNGGKIEAAFKSAVRALLRRRKLVAEGEWLLPSPDVEE